MTVKIIQEGKEPGQGVGYLDDGTMVVTDGPYTETTEYLGGITIIEVATIEEAREWAAKVAEGCGWPQEVRVVK